MKKTLWVPWIAAAVLFTVAMWVWPSDNPRWNPPTRVEWRE